MQLTERDLKILRDVVRTYLLSGEPVSSRTVARQARLGVSAATIRNAMADLEELGYLDQPHASSGRVPSSSGLHFYIDTLMEARDLPVDQRREIEGELAGASSDGDDLVARTTQLLSRFSGQVGVVLTPAFGDTVLAAVDFVPLSGRRVLCVIASHSGFVAHKLVEAEEEISREELVRVSNYLTETFRGQTLRSIRQWLLARMGEDRAQVDRLLGRAIFLAARGLDAEGSPEVRVEGASLLLAQGGASDLDRVRKLLETFGERRRLVDLLSLCLDGNGVRVVIGEENDVTSDLGLTLVARPYGGAPGAERGTLGILGPARMPYDRIIPLVDFLGEALSRALVESSGTAEGAR